jgi:hypothetical protein
MGLVGVRLMSKEQNDEERVSIFLSSGERKKNPNPSGCNR